MSLIRIRQVLILIGVAIVIYGISEIDLSDLSYAGSKDGYIFLVTGIALVVSNAMSNRHDLRRTRQQSTD